MTWQGGGGLGAPFRPPSFSSIFSSGQVRAVAPRLIHPFLALPQSGAANPCSEKHGTVPCHVTTDEGTLKPNRVAPVPSLLMMSGRGRG